MVAKNQEPVQVAQAVEWREEQFPSVYSNVASVGITPFDISLICGEVESATPSAVKARPQVRIFFSPEQASLVMQMLQQALNKFVEGSGPLRPVGNLVNNPNDFKFRNK